MAETLEIPLNRRGFVTLGSAGALLIANGAAAAAQTDGFGQPHPPIVAEDDPAIVVSRPKITPKEASTIDAYAAMPRTVTRTTPGVVVVQHIWGIDPVIRDIVRRFAKAGYITIAPNLFARISDVPSAETTLSDYKPFQAVAQKMTKLGHVSSDLIAGEDWIRSQAAGSAVGITGFCMGGGLVLKQIIDSKAFAAASMFYGSVRPADKPDATAPDFSFTSRITTPLLGSFGARDTSIKAEDVTAMFARLTSPHDVKIYDEAGHAFMDDTRPSYVPSAAADAWNRTLSWFHRYLT